MAAKVDEDEAKGRKFEREQAKRSSILVMCFGLFGIMFLAAIIKVKHGVTKYTPRSLRQVDKKIQKDFPPSSFLPPNSIYRLSVEGGNGQRISLEKFVGMVTLVVNVASHWGKTQLSYEQMSQLQERYGAKGFSVLAFPTNDFHQELPENDAIQNFVKENFPQVTFPVFGISSLNNNPVYVALHKQMPETKIEWNFFKYLVNDKGIPVAFYTLHDAPLTLSDSIEALLGENIINPHHHYATQ